MKKVFFAIFATALALWQPALADNTPRVISSIYPLQQIANAIVGAPTALLVDNQRSPHGYTLKPRDIRYVTEADLLVRIGDAMMPQLSQVEKNRQANNKQTITAATLANVQLLHEERTFRPSFAGTHVANAQYNMQYDPHLWLSTGNAVAIATAIADALSDIDHDNRVRYQANLHAFIAELQQLKQQIKADFSAKPPRPYFIFHDAYHYFEEEFNVQHIGIIRTHAGQMPRTKHLVELKKKIAQSDGACLFREPQFQSRLIDKLRADSNISVAVLDPLGYFNKSKDAGYSAILRNIAKALQHCGQGDMP